jgi:hypothetical protein
MPKWFIISVGVMLLTIGFAKCFNVLGGPIPEQHLLRIPDPILSIRFGQLMLLVGIIEVSIAIVCLLTDLREIALALVAWMAVNFMLYRIGLWLIGWQHPCGCLGYLTVVLHIPPRMTEWISRGIIAYMALGSYVFLFGKERKPAIKPA